MNEESNWDNLLDELDVPAKAEKPAKTSTQHDRVEAPSHHTEEQDGDEIGDAPEALEEPEGEAETGEETPGDQPKKKRRRRRRGKKKPVDENGNPIAVAESGEADSEEGDDDSSDEADEASEGSSESAIDEEISKGMQKPNWAKVVSWKEVVAALHRPN
jgi:ribonuclease E